MADLYQALWQRNPDLNSWSYWTRQVQIRGRAWVLEHFIASTAFQEVAGTLYREVFWLVPDQLGTPRMVAERTRSLAGIKRHDYLPFGEEITSGIGGRTPQHGYINDGLRQHFTSIERDDETGLDYFQARYCSSVQGRFTSPDEFPGLAAELFTSAALSNPTFYSDPTNPQTLNKYHYCFNNPLRYIDPTGHDTERGLFSSFFDWIYGQSEPNKLETERSASPWGVALEDLAAWFTINLGDTGMNQLDFYEKLDLIWALQTSPRSLQNQDSGKQTSLAQAWQPG